MDETGMALVLPEYIDTDRARAYATALAAALDDPDADPAAVLAEYQVGTGGDPLADADDGAQVLFELEEFLSLLPAIAADDLTEDGRPWGRLVTVRGVRLLLLEPDTGADWILETAWCRGIAAAAGCALPD